VLRREHGQKSAWITNVRLHQRERMSVRSAGRCARAGFLERRAIRYLGNVIVRP
jgi:hypothetical protein